MFEASTAMGVASLCTTCGKLPTAERYVLPDGKSLRVYCSRACLRGGVRSRRLKVLGAWARGLRRISVALILVGAWLAPRDGLWRRRAPVASDVEAPAPAQSSPPELPPGWFGPEWPPTETSVLAVLGRDAWVHPLAGPVRRMPRADSRVFGADRPGARAVECRNGHCGVDLGGEIWGEHIRAAHDGVVDYVQRGPNPDHGGRFVRISHHDGTIFTQYFHLAAIPRGIERGVAVKGGQVIGLLGDSGVKESQPHLHFAVSVRATPQGHEKYMDPEPLIALWPVRVPLDGSEVGFVTITAPPGVPLGSALRHAGRARKGADKPAKSDEAASPESAPADEGEAAGESAGEAGGEAPSDVPAPSGSEE